MRNTPERSEVLQNDQAFLDILGSGLVCPHNYNAESEMFTPLPVKRGANY
jgi:hypothetical protein